MEVRSPSPFVHRLLQVTGLTELFGLPDLRTCRSTRRSQAPA